MTDEPSDEPTMAEALAESAKRLEAQKQARERGPAGKTEMSPGDGASEGDGAGADEAVPAKKPVPTPEPEAAKDLAHVPEEIRSVIAADPKLAKWAAGVLEKSVFTQKTQEIAKEREQLAADKEKLRFAESILADETLMDVVYEHGRKARKGEANGAAAGGAPAKKSFDFFASSPEDILAYLDEREHALEERVVSRNKKGAEEVLDEKLLKPEAEKRARATAAVQAFHVGKGVPLEKIDEAFRKCAAALEDSDIKITSKNVVALLSPYLEGAASGNEAAGGNGSNGSGAKGVSALTRGGGLAPLPPPAHVREGRAAKTVDERISETLHSLSKAKGRNVTLASLTEAPAK